MGKPFIARSHIEIAAPPNVVREKFLDFDSFSQFQNNIVLSPADKNKKPADLQVGDELTLKTMGMTLHPKVIENSPSSFQWTGSVAGMVTGTHRFFFEPSEVSPGATTLVNVEEFSGWLTSLMKPFMTEDNSKQNTGYDQFNRGFKALVERQVV